MPNKILILFAHPRYEKSRANHMLVSRIPKSDRITFHDLYERYPNFNVDIDFEKKLLTDHDIIIWHHPVFWYSSPPLLKQWIDMVLEFGWAYGPGGNALSGKFVFNTLTTGGAREAYQHEGRNRFTVKEFLAPFDQTVHLCKMTFLPPFSVQGTHKLSLEDLTETADNYGDLLRLLSESELNAEDIKKYDSMNDWLKAQKGKLK